MLVSRELDAAYWALRIAFGLGPLLAGLDKFTNVLVNWEKLLEPGRAARAARGPHDIHACRGRD